MLSIDKVQYLLFRLFIMDGKQMSFINNSEYYTKDATIFYSFLIVFLIPFVKKVNYCCI